MVSPGERKGPSVAPPITKPKLAQSRKVRKRNPFQSWRLGASTSSVTDVEKFAKAAKIAVQRMASDKTSFAFFIVSAVLASVP